MQKAKCARKCESVGFSADEMTRADSGKAGLLRLYKEAAVDKHVYCPLNSELQMSWKLRAARVNIGEEISPVPPLPIRVHFHLHLPQESLSRLWGRIGG